MDKWGPPMKWAEQFFEEAKAKDLHCAVTTRVLGWPETMVVRGKKCFVKSITYNTSRNLYFDGVDSKKLEENGDFVLLCGGINNKLRDIFIIPWKVFFQTLKEGKPVNTYKPPKKEYYQYKFYIKDKNGKWIMTVQGGRKPEIDVSEFRYRSNEAIEQLKQP
jgi:hypothetical protein